MMKPNIPSQYIYVGSWEEENHNKKWFEKFQKKTGKKPKKQNDNKKGK